MSVTLKENVYGLTGTGKKVRIGHVTEVEADLFPVGGKIFYIDETSDRVVEFYDQYGDLIENVSVGDSPYAYKVVSEGSSGKDKYYVYWDEMFTSKRWTYYENGSYVYNSLGTQDGIGKGKGNTAIVMAADSGKYITNDSNGVATLWYTLKQMRDNKYGGCDDWFVPSKAEIEELRKAIGFQVVTTSDDPVILSAGAVTGGVIAGTADGQAHYRDYSTTRTCYPSATKFLDNYIWASSEYSAQGAWFWHYGAQVWDGSGKHSGYSFFAVRAF